MKHAKFLEATFAVTVIVLGVSFATAGSLEPKTVEEFDGLGRILSIKGVELGPVLWADGLRNSSAWTLLSSANAGGTKTAEGSLQLTAKFAQGTNDKEVEAYRDVNLSLDVNPVLSFQIDVSNGISYGISFQGLYPNGTSFDTWNDTSYLQHRTGIGSPEDISANLAYETFLATGNQAPVNSRIVRMLFYLEAGPSVSGEFSMNISGITAYGVSVSFYRWSGGAISGNFLEVLLDLRQPVDSPSFYQAYMGFDIEGTADLQYAGFLTQGYSVLAQSFNYRTKTTTPYEYMLLSSEQELVGAPPPYLDGTSYSLVLSAQQGVITFFKLDSLAMKYAAFNSATISASDLPFLQGMFLLYVALLFQVPIGAVIVLYEVRKVEE